MSYVTGEKREGCVFCNALKAGADAENLIIHRGERAFVILNLYPYNSGHSMVVPYEHAASIEEIDAVTRAEMFELANLMLACSRSVLRCDGFNLGMNIGDVAGAGVAEHVHWHVVPRWTGDANFMPILSSTMVMPELLPATYARLRAEVEGVLAARRGLDVTAGMLTVYPEQRSVVLRRGKAGELVLPKGQVESGESLAQAALRELHEETGFRARITGWGGAHEFALDGRRRWVAYLVGVAEPTAEADAHLATDTVLASIEEAAGIASVPQVSQLITEMQPALFELCERP